jgi:hypothetical protein
VTFKGPALRVVKKDPAAASVAVLRARSLEGAPELPGVVTRTYGKGRVAYFAAGLDSGYYLYAYPYQRLALKHAILWAAPEAPPVRVEAPMCVHSTVMRQSKSGQRLVVHLFSDLNTTGQHALPADDVPLREETIPIPDIKVNFSAGYKIRRFHLEPEGLALKPVRTKDGVQVTVPRLEVHSMVVAELAE